MNTFKKTKVFLSVFVQKRSSVKGALVSFMICKINYGNSLGKLIKTNDVKKMLRKQYGYCSVGAVLGERKGTINGELKRKSH